MRRARLQMAMIDYAQILPDLFIGSYPASRSDVDRLQREAGITAVLNLQTEEDFAHWGIDWPAQAAHYRASGVEVRRVPIRDFDPDDLREKLIDAVGALRQLLEANHTVYVHCTAGVGRAPAVTIAYLHWVRGLDLDRAVAHVKQRRACSPTVEAIRLATQDLPDEVAKH